MDSFGSWLLIEVLSSYGQGEEAFDVAGMVGDGLHLSLVQRDC